MAYTSSPPSCSQPASPAGTLQAHPDFELPAPKSEEQTKLPASITANGVREPIGVSARPGCPAAVADGRARLHIAQTLRLPCPRRLHPFKSEPQFRLYRLNVRNVIRKRRHGEGRRIKNEAGWALTTLGKRDTPERLPELLNAKALRAELNYFRSSR